VSGTLGRRAVRQVGAKAVDQARYRARQRELASAGSEIAAVDEYQSAVTEPDRPPPRRVRDVMLADVHALAKVVAKVLHDDAETFTVGARIDPHRYTDSDAPAGQAVPCPHVDQSNTITGRWMHN